MKKILLHSCCGPCSVMCIEHLLDSGFRPSVFYYNPNIHPQKEYNLRLNAMRQVSDFYGIPLTIGSSKAFFDSLKQQKLPLNKEELQNSRRIFEKDSLMRQAVQKILDKWKNYAELFPSRLYDGLAVYAENADTRTLSADEAKSLLAVDSYAFVSHLKNYKEKERCRQCYKERMTKSVQYAFKQDFKIFTSTLLYSKYQSHEDICQAIEFAVNAVNSQNNADINFYYADFREFWQQGIDKSKELNIYRQKWCGCILSRLESLEQMAVREYEKLLKRLRQNA